jgi:hypothetical protein
MLWQRVVAATDSLKQSKHLDVPWPEDNPGLKEAFDAVPSEELAAAMFIIYRWGHWSHIAAITVELPNTDPKKFVTNDFDVFSPSTQVKAWVRDMLKSDVDFSEQDVKYTHHRAGPDNTKTVGAYWKFESLAKASLIARKYVWNEDRLARDLDFDQESFMDHKPGTTYDNNEKHVLFKELLNGDFEAVKVTTCNHRPHPFCIGTKHVAYASEHCNGILGVEAMRSAPCAMQEGSYPRRMCGLSYDEHTHETVLMLRPLRDMENEDAASVLTLIKPLLEEHKIDGIALLKSDFTISDPMWMCTVRCHTDVPRDQWDADDQADNPVGSYNFTPRAPDEKAAREAALDQFHSTVPISDLEMFQVDVEVMPRTLATEPESESV